jgi:4-amino-4-deoxy-L-arabinose transferase-like glycosyltransferase
MAAEGAVDAEQPPIAPPSAPRNADWRAPALVFAALTAFVVALALRLAFVVEAHASPFLDHRLIDEQDYNNLAQGYLHGKWPGAEALFRPPLYPLFLAATYRLVGSDVWTVRLAQGALGSLVAPLTVWVGARVLGSVRLGLAAGLVVAACGTLVYYDVQLLAASLDSLLMIGTVALLLRSEATGRSRDWLLAGAVAGLSAANRGTMLVMVPVLFGWALAKRESPAARRRVLKHLGAFAAAFVFVIAPIAWHNARNDDRPEASYAPAAPVATTAVVSVPATIGRLVLGRCAPLGWASGINLYVGNDPDIAALNDDANVAHFDWFNDLSADPWKDGAKTAHEHADWFKARTRQRIAAHPLRWLGLIGYKVLEVINGYEIPRGTSPYAERVNSRLLGLLLWDGPLRFPSGVLLPLGIAGAWCLRKDRRSLLLGLVMATQLAFVVLVFVTARYRAPAIPLAAVLAIGLVAQAVHRLRARTVAWPRESLGAAAVALLVVCANVRLARQSFTRSAIEEYDLADEFVHEGKGDDAIAHVRAAIAIAPQFADAHVYLGFLYGAAGRIDDAIEQYRVALRLTPDNATAQNNLGNALLARHDLPGAEDAFRAAARTKADYAEPRFSLGEMLMVRGDPKGALLWLEEANRLKYPDPRLPPLLAAARQAASNP